MKELTPLARIALKLAEQESDRIGDDFIGTGHILVGLMKATGSLACDFLATIPLWSVREFVESSRKTHKQIESNTGNWIRLPLSEASVVINYGDGLPPEVLPVEGYVPSDGVIRGVRPFKKPSDSEVKPNNPKIIKQFSFKITKEMLEESKGCTVIDEPFVAGDPSKTPVTTPGYKPKLPYKDGSDAVIDGAQYREGYDGPLLNPPDDDLPEPVYVPKQ